MKKTNTLALSAIWFGAAVSVAEIEAGIQAGSNWCALILGHVLGGILLFLAGLIGAKTQHNAMQTTQGVFGKWGGGFFAVLNSLQLVGWTAVMVAQGAMAISALSNLAFPLGCVILALLVAIWLYVVVNDKFHFTTIGMVLLAVLAVVLTIKLTTLSNLTIAKQNATTIDFWTAFEISVAMPLSWLPLISDYTRNAQRPVWGTFFSALVYTIVSVWMYALGICLSNSGSTDLAMGIRQAGLGWIGLVIVVFSTVTTTFLDAYSSGESIKVIFPKAKSQLVGVIVCAVGAVLAISGVVEKYVDFLYLIASVFAPMASVLIVSYYVVRQTYAVWNIFAWLVGTITYHLASSSPIGPTLTALLVSTILALIPKLISSKRI